MVVGVVVVEQLAVRGFVAAGSVADSVINPCRCSCSNFSLAAVSCQVFRWWEGRGSMRVVPAMDTLEALLVALEEAGLADPAQFWNAIDRGC